MTKSTLVSEGVHFINDKKELMTFGDSDKNTTGLGYEPKIDLITPERIMSNMESTNSSWGIHLASNTRGELYSWGYTKKDYILGRIVEYKGSPNNAHKLPGKVHNTDPIKYIGRPSKENFIVVAESGRAYGAGKNRFSELALGSQGNAYYDTGKYVRELSEVAKAIRWKTIDFVEQSMVIGIAENGLAYIWGGRSSGSIVSVNCFLHYESSYRNSSMVSTTKGGSKEVTAIAHEPILISNERIKKADFYYQQGLFILLTEDGRLLVKGSNGMFDLPENVAPANSMIKQGGAYSEREISRNMRFQDFILSDKYIIAIEKETKKAYSFYNGTAFSSLSAGMHGIDFTREDKKAQAQLIRERVGEPWIQIADEETFEQFDYSTGALYMLSTKGQLYGWGYSSEGRLGNLTNAIYVYTPTLISNIIAPRRLRGYNWDITVVDEPEKDVVHMVNIPLHKDFKKIISKFEELEKNENFIKIQFLIGLANAYNNTNSMNAIIKDTNNSFSRKKVNVLGNYTDSEKIETFIDSLNAIKGRNIGTGSSRQYVTIYVICRMKASFEDEVRKLFQITFDSDEVSLTSSGYGFSKIENWRIDG